MVGLSFDWVRLCYGVNQSPAYNIEWWRFAIPSINYSFLAFVLRREAPIIANTINAPGVTAATANAAESFNLSCRLDVNDDLLVSGINHRESKFF